VLDWPGPRLTSGWLVVRPVSSSSEEVSGLARLSGIGGLALALRDAKVMW